jgi:hypothetical protein
MCTSGGPAVRDGRDRWIPSLSSWKDKLRVQRETMPQLNKLKKKVNRQTNKVESNSERPKIKLSSVLHTNTHRQVPIYIDTQTHILRERQRDRHAHRDRETERDRDTERHREKHRRN